VTIYRDIIISQKQDRFNSFVLALNVKLFNIRKKMTVNLALATVYRPLGL